MRRNGNWNNPYQSVGGLSTYCEPHFAGASAIEIPDYSSLTCKLESPLVRQDGNRWKKRALEERNPRKRAEEPLAELQSYSAVCSHGEPDKQSRSGGVTGRRQNTEVTKQSPLSDDRNFSRSFLGL